METKSEDVKEAKKILEEIEHDLSKMRWSHQRADKFRKAGELFKDAGMEEEYKKMTWESHLFNLRTRSQSEKKEKGIREHFCPLIEFTDGRAYPTLENFPEESLDYFEKRADETKNSILLARYFDFIWEKRGKHIFARKAIQAYLDCVPVFIQNDWDMELADGLQRATELALSIADKNKQTEVKAKILSTMDDLANNKKYRYCLELTDALLQFKNKLSDEEIGHMEKILREGADYYKSEEVKNYHLCRAFLQRLIKLYKLIKDEKRIKETKYEIAYSYELEAELKKGSKLVAAHFYEQALLKYQELEDKNKVDELKVKVTNYYKDAEAEFKKIETEIEIPLKEIDERINKMLSLPIEDILFHLALDDSLIPDMNRIRKYTKEQQKEFPLSNLFSRAVIKDGKLVYKSDTEEDKFEHLVRRNTLLEIQISNIVFCKILDRLKEEGKLNIKSLTSYLKGWELMPEENFVIIKIGIERYFSDDYASAVHIFVPQLEAVIRKMFERAGFHTTTVKEEKTQEQTLGGFLKRPDVKSTFGENIATYLDIILAAQDGLNLRNEVAHGLIKKKLCSKEIVEMVIHLYLILTRFKLMKTIEG